MSGFLSTMVGVSPSAPAVTYPIFGSITATNTNYVYADYQHSPISYVGPDSSNRPVFLFAFKKTSNTYLYCQLIRINTDATITEGSTTQITSVAGANDIWLESEYEGANSFGNGTPTNYAYMCYRKSGNYLARVANCDVNNMSITLGTEVDTSLSADADQPVCAYVGNSRAVFGGRTGGGPNVKRYSRSGTTLTSEGTTSGDLGWRTYHGAFGFLNNGTTQYRLGFAATGGGGENNVYGAAAMGSSNYNSSGTVAVGGTVSSGCNLNHQNKLLSFTTFDKKLTAVSITWNASSAPTLSAGTTVLAGTREFRMAHICSGHVADEAFLVYHTATNLYYRPITVSGTTVTVGSEVTWGTLSGPDYSNGARAATVGTAKYLLSYVDRTGNTPYWFGARLA